MNIPNGWVPSNAGRLLQYDEEGRFREVNLSRQATGGIGDRNSTFASEAERYDSVAPHLARNKARDAGRRNYAVQPGGATIYFEGPAAIEDPYLPGPYPSDRESFGHESDPRGPTMALMSRSSR